MPSNKTMIRSVSEILGRFKIRLASAALGLLGVALLSAGDNKLAPRAVATAPSAHTP